MKILGQRLKQLRKNKNITQSELGKIINVGKSTISQYESGISNPDYETLKKLADFFNVSTDYLLGRTDNPTPKVNDPIKKETMTDRLDNKKTPDSNLVEINDIELKEMVNWLIQAWQNGDYRMRGWLAVQFEKAFPEYRERLEKKQRVIGESMDPGNKES